MKNWSRIYLTTGLTALTLTGFLFFVQTSVPAVEVINLKGRDFFFQLGHLLFPPPPEMNQIVLVTLDDETLQRIESRWPYSRSIYGEVLKRLNPFSPKAVGFDLIFSGNDISPGSDSAFVGALKEAGNVVIASHKDSAGEVGPSSLIRQGAWEVGIVDKPRDSDHVIRRSFLSFSIGGKQYSSWELALLRKAFSSKGIQKFPQNSEIVIDYRLQFNEFPQISFWRLLEGSVLAKEVRDKIVLIGLTAESFHDIHETPLGLMPGLAVNANVLLMLMDHGFFSFAPVWIAPALSFFSFWLTLLVAFSNPFGAAFLIVIVLILIFLAVSFLLFLNQMILDLWLIALGIILALITAVIFNEAQVFLIHLKLKKELVRDSLTGFYNRNFLYLKLELEFHRLLSGRSWFKSNPEISVVMFGLDRFKKTNDSSSRSEKDRVLQTMAEAIRTSVRKDELICRYGESEFCVVLPSTSLQDAAKFAVKIRKLIQDHPTFKISIGVVSRSSTKANHPAQLLKAAEQILSRARSNNENQICVFDPAQDIISQIN